MDNRTIATRRRNASVYDNARNLYDRYAYEYTFIDKLTPTSWKIERRNRPPDPAHKENHIPYEVPGKDGKYTTFNEDGTPRPNIKENKIENDPKGPRPGKYRVRPARPSEIPK